MFTFSGTVIRMLPFSGELSMKKTTVLLLSLFFSAPTLAQTLTVDNYLAQVKQSNPGMESAILLEEAAAELQNEGQHLYAPNLFADYAHVYDKRPTLIPAFQGNKTVQDILHLGVKQQTGFGLQSSVYYAMNTSTIYGVDPLFYPQPHLNVESINLELKQSLLQNGFGRSTRAVIASRNAQRLANLHHQKFQRKIVTSEAENNYWQLSITRALVAVQQNSLDRTNQFHKLNAKRAKLHLIDNADLVASEAALKQRELELKNAIDQEKVAARMFNESRGINSDQVLETLDSVSPEFIATLPEIQKLLNGDDVKAAQADVEVQRTSAVAARDERLPTLDMIAKLSTNGLDPTWENALDQTIGTNYPAITVGASLNVPLDFSKNNKVRKAYDKQIQGAQKATNTPYYPRTFPGTHSINSGWIAKSRLILRQNFAKPKPPNRKRSVTVSKMTQHNLSGFPF
ncbi:MAG: TolC family protein [Bdellovibrionota bacterium]